MKLRVDYMFGILYREWYNDVEKRTISWYKMTKTSKAFRFKVRLLCAQVSMTFPRKWAGYRNTKKEEEKSFIRIDKESPFTILKAKTT